MDARAIEAELVRYLREELGVDTQELGRDGKLVRTGLLDSVNLVQVATHLERTFGVTIPDQDIDADHMDSVAMIVEYVMARA